MRVGRAKEHADLLNAEWRAFSNEHPVRLVIQPYTNVGMFRLVIEDLPHPPARLSLLAGEVVQSLNSALDHLIWLLVMINRKTPAGTTPSPSTRTPARSALTLWAAPKTEAPAVWKECPKTHAH
jgi:hypothetical protein